MISTSLLRWKWRPTDSQGRPPNVNTTFSLYVSHFSKLWTSQFAFNKREIERHSLVESKDYEISSQQTNESTAIWIYRLFSAAYNEEELFVHTFSAKNRDINSRGTNTNRGKSLRVLFVFFFFNFLPFSYYRRRVYVICQFPVFQL